jgi:hypothetical protein
MSFAAYQSLGSRSSAQASSKPFSSTVDFSDPSYDMPYFESAEVSVPKAQNIQRNAAAFQQNAKGLQDPLSKQGFTASKDVKGTTIPKTSHSGN